MQLAYYINREIGIRLDDGTEILIRHLSFPKERILITREGNEYEQLASIDLPEPK